MSTELMSKGPMVTYMNSQTATDAMRSATVVSVTFYKGFSGDTSGSAVGTATFSIPPQSYQMSVRSPCVRTDVVN
jgi:hypothetical protein